MAKRKKRLKTRRQHSFLTVLSRILFLLLVVVVIAAAVLFLVPLTETRDPVKIQGSEKWMGNISDDALLTEISVPGTHDSATEYVQLAFFSKCQASDIYTQLNDGFRYLDIRLGMDKKGGDEALSLWHGFCRCKTSFWPWSPSMFLDDVLEQCYRFLDENPSETIIFSVKIERDCSTSDFQRLLKKYTDENTDFWLLTDTIPKLGECRGKIVLFRRYADEAGLGKASGIEMIWNDQGNAYDINMNAAYEKEPGYTLLVQDRYKYGTDDKWSAFLRGLETPKADGDVLRLHFLSTNGSVKFGHPYIHSKSLNQRLLGESLVMPESAFTTSWIIVDFSNAALAEHIYSVNFK